MTNTKPLTAEEIYTALSPAAEGLLSIPKFDPTVSMNSTPTWDSLNHIQLLAAAERQFGIEISEDDAFRLTSAEKLVRYLQAALEKGPQA
jgi:acyl carrier protein